MEETIHPLFSCFITLYTLILIYSPLRILLSPVLLISGSLLFFLIRLGSTRDSNTRPGNENRLGETESVNLEESRVLVRETDFVEWNLRAPLEVIHEAYEEEDPSDSGENDPTRFREIERFPSLSLCYPESDSDSSSEFNFPEVGNWNSPEKMGFRWEEEEEDDGIGGLIEIKLDECKRRKWNQTELDFHAEEDGLIEIDLFP